VNPESFAKLAAAAQRVYKVAIAYAVVAWLLMQVATLHHSLNSPLCSCVWITLPAAS
jgi:hypothetical protein